MCLGRGRPIVSPIAVSWIIVVFITLAAFPALTSAATIEVDVTTDELNGDADCSLREAVQAANLNNPVSGCRKGQGAKTDIIRLIPGEIFQLTIPSTDEDLNNNGDLDLVGGGPVTLKGNARAMGGPVIVAPANDRAIEVLDVGGAATIRKLNLEGGDVSGLGSGDDYGGVVRAIDAPLTIDEVNVEDGTAVSGGAIYATNLTVIGSAVGGSEATELGGGIYAVGNRLVIKRTFVGQNDVAGTASTVFGGGVMASVPRTKIVDTAITFNDAEATSVAGNARGGGLYSSSAPLSIRRSLISGNRALDAGGASFGGGIDGFLGRVQVLNSTLFGNDSDGVGGAIHSGRGSISHATLAENEAADGGDHVAVTFDGPVSLRNSIIAGLSPVDLCDGDPGTFASKGYNVFQLDDPDCGFVGRDEQVTDIGFKDATPLPNGGHTFTIAIAGTSPAKDLIPQRKCKVARGEDQRSFERPRGKRCDAGAFERGAQP